MIPWIAPVTLILGLLIVTAAATASRTILDFSHRQLEVYSRAQRRREMFKKILQTHDEVAFAVDKLETVGLILTIGSATLIFYHALGTVAIGMLLLWLLVGVLLLFAVTSWIPTAVARQCSGPFLLLTWRLWWLTHWCFWPLRWGPQVVDVVVRRLSGKSEPPDKDEQEDDLENEIMTIVTEGQRDGLLESDARDMIKGVIELGDAEVKEIMTPRSHVDWVDIHMNWSEIQHLITRSGRTRLPVCDGSLDATIGILYVKDLLSNMAGRSDQPERTLTELVRPAWRIPETMPLLNLLRNFRWNRRHLAIVVNEYDTVVGVVTIEDVLEEIVGEIVDESDQEEDDGIRMLNDATFEVVGTTLIDVVNERLGVDLPEADDYETLAGLIVSRLGFIPRRGETMTCGNVRLTVLRAEPRKVQRLLVEIPVEVAPSDDQQAGDSPR
jgi:putative hemolysin